jgi:hypothetical protein
VVEKEVEELEPEIVRPPVLWAPSNRFVSLPNLATLAEAEDELRVFGSSASSSSSSVEFMLHVLACWKITLSAGASEGVLVELRRRGLDVKKVAEESSPPKEVEKSGGVGEEGEGFVAVSDVGGGGGKVGGEGGFGKRTRPMLILLLRSWVKISSLVASQCKFVGGSVSGGLVGGWVPGNGWWAPISIGDEGICLLNFA